MDPVLTSFEFSCQTPEMPPQWAWIDAQVREFLPAESRILSWAVVKTDLALRQLWIEGSYFGAPIAL